MRLRDVQSIPAPLRGIRALWSLCTITYIGTWRVIQNAKWYGFGHDNLANSDRAREGVGGAQRHDASWVWHTTYSYRGVNCRIRYIIQYVAVSVVVLVSFAACRGRSPDAGGDVALARDLAEAQLAGFSASAGGRVASDSSDPADSAHAGGAHADSARALPARANDPPTPTEARSTVRDPVARTASSRTVSSRKGQDRMGKTVKQPATDPCASSESRDQNSCLSLGVARSDARLDSIYQLIVKAVRKQQRVPAGAADPPYATTLAHAERTWASWRDAECARVTRGKGGDQWAVPRAKCLATLTDERAAELTQILATALKH
jgi:uncharacterized protein YecT (DUF1311 family)